MKKPWVGGKLSWLWLVGAAIGFLVLVALVCALFVSPRFPAVLSLLDVVLGWPLAVGILGIAFIERFEPELRQYLLYLKIRLPSGAQITGQPPLPADAAAREDETLEEAAGTSTKAEASANPLEFFLAFFYLDTFLVPTTLAILHWIAEAGESGVSMMEYVGYAAALTPDPSQTEIILQVLQATFLARRTDDNRLVINDLGKQYLEHRHRLGRTPSTVPPPNPAPPGA